MKLGNVNRPPNPHRDEHRRLTSQGNAASDRGDHAEAMRLWRQAGELKRAGQAAIRMPRKKKEGS